MDLECSPEERTLCACVGIAPFATIPQVALGVNTVELEITHPLGQLWRTREVPERQSRKEVRLARIFLFGATVI